MKLFKIAVMASTSALTLVATAAQAQNLTATATHAHNKYPASNAVDGDTSFATRWAGRGTPERLVIDLGGRSPLMTLTLHGAEMINEHTLSQSKRVKAMVTGQRL